MTDSAGHLRLRRGWLLSVLPATLWEFAFLIVPLLSIFFISFLSRGEYGTVEFPFTLENYKRLAGFSLLGFDALYPIILLRSVLLALVTAILCALAGMPLAFFAAARKGPARSLALILLTIPVWTNLLVRTYAWQILLGPESWISRLASSIGFITSEHSLYPGTIPVLLCLLCDYLPFAALPIYASVERLDRSLVEAAQDLGASQWSIFRHSIYPQISPGLWAGFLLVFLPATGQFVIPDLLGGGKTVLLGNVLQQQFGPSRDWPFGSAFTTLSILLVLAGVLFYLKFSRVEKEAK
jgi:spermidine/putrescine transport system permease protein